jgi:hypothetical protein
VVDARAGGTGHTQPAGAQLGVVPSEIPPRPGIDHVIAGQPDDAALVRIPVALLVGHLDNHGWS